MLHAKTWIETLESLHAAQLRAIHLTHPSGDEGFTFRVQPALWRDTDITMTLDDLLKTLHAMRQMDITYDLLPVKVRYPCIASNGM